MKELSQELKEKIVDEVNADTDEIIEEGNTKLFNLDETEGENSMGESAQAQYEKSITANAQALYSLQMLFSNQSSKISKRNMIKLIFATLKLPEEGATLEFGGTREQKQMCEFAYAQMQLACNTKCFILGVNAMKQQRRAMKAKEEESNNEAKQDLESKENSNE